jgi:phosphatidylglycerol:prolipoprotein diacylglycerol transferase
MYDLFLRVFASPSYYIIINKNSKVSTIEEYLEQNSNKSTIRYLESASKKRDDNSIKYIVKTYLISKEFQFAKDIFLQKHKDSLILFYIWYCFIRSISYDKNVRFTTVIDEGNIIAIFIEYKTTSLHYFISALVDHDKSKDNGVYLCKYTDMIKECISKDIKILRLGPKADSLKINLGAIPFPLFIVDDPVWYHIKEKISIVCFGVFTSFSLFLYLFLTQWHLDSIGQGALTLYEMAKLYIFGMFFVKTIPLISLGTKFFRNPLKYLKQTTFYAQGGLIGLIPFLYTYSKSAIKLLDGLSMFAFLAEAIGRLGCHYYGCCFGKPCNKFRVFSVLYINKRSSVSRLHPEYMYMTLLPVQLGQSMFAMCSFIIMMLYFTNNKTYYTGSLFITFMFLYNIDRIIFFFLRADEAYKSKKSYTTLYLSILSLVTSICMIPFISSNITINHILLPIPPIYNIVCHLFTAIIFSTINLLIQGIHDYKNIGTFPSIKTVC